MKKFVIGDIQGCLDELKILLDKLDFNSSSDQLIFVGDLVNRGPDSLGVLEYLYSINHCVINTLGNHDLHLLALAMTDKRFKHKDESLIPILESKNKNNLIEWLRHQPIIHEEPSHQSIMVHAGFHPLWDLKKIRKYAREIEMLIRSNDVSKILTHMYTDESWSNNLKGTSRINSIINTFTRIRFIDQFGTCNFVEKNAPNKNNRFLMPWFKSNAIKHSNLKIFFGHWSTLGHFNYRNFVCLDGGCVWGEEMIAIDLENPSKPIKVKSLISK